MGSMMLDTLLSWSDGGDEIGGVLGDVDIVVPFATEQLGRAVGQVGAEHGGDDAVLVRLVKTVETLVNSGKVA